MARNPRPLRFVVTSMLAVTPLGACTAKEEPPRVNVRKEPELPENKPTTKEAPPEEPDTKQPQLEPERPPRTNVVKVPEPEPDRVNVAKEPEPPKAGPQ